MTASLLKAEGISKTFGGAHALSDVSLDIEAGEAHAICGENGAGKSTLIKILAGSYTPDKGRILLNNQPLPPGDIRASEKAGIHALYQESTAFPHLCAMENIFMGREPVRMGGLLLDKKTMRLETKKLMESLGEVIDQNKPVGQLPMAQRQMIGIARALLHKSRVLIMDEPTASLSERETIALFRIIRQLKDQGVSILYISHRLEEIFEISDRVTVLRDGKLVSTNPTPNVTKADLIRMMVGRELSVSTDIAPSLRETKKVLLEVRSLSRKGSFENISFHIRAGEILGLSGLVGAGRSEVAQTIFGIDKPDSGSVLIEGKPLSSGSVKSAIQKGLALVPEDRQHLGLILPMPIGVNLTLAVLRNLTRFGISSSLEEKNLVARMMKELDVRAPDASAAAETLSGGNQQKLVIGKWLAASPRVLLLDEPTRGVDVGAKAEIYELIHKLSKQGMATLLISSDLPEILSLSDRIMVMRNGGISGELSREEATQEKILSLALPKEEARSNAISKNGAGLSPLGNRKSAENQKKNILPAKDLFIRLAQRREIGLLFLLFSTILIVSIVNPAFLSAGNIRDILVKIAPVAIAGCGVTLVILTGEIDISIGSLMGLIATIVGLLTSPKLLGLPVSIGIAAGLLTGLGIGLLNGVLVTYGRIPSIIVTLGMLTALRGINELLMGGKWITDLPPYLRYFGIGTFAEIPISLWTALIVIILSIILARQTPLGRRIYAVGSNPEAARLAGLSNRKIKIFVFGFTGFLTAIATIVSVTQLSVIESGIGVGFELLVVTCVVVGGTSISGGRGNIAGTLLGALLLGMVGTVLIFLRLGEMSTYWERAIQGSFILMAVLVDHLANIHSRTEAAG